MKRIYFILILLVMSMSAQANNKVIVQNAEKVSIYDDLATAVSNAVAGDTLYLSDGTYDAITISKLVYLRGTGNSAISGNLTLDIGANPSPTDALLEGLRIEGILQVNKKITNLIIRQCQMNDFSTAVEIPNALMDRCRVNNCFYNTNTGGLTVRNSYILFYQGAEANCTLINCNVKYLRTKGNNTYLYPSGIFKNCIFYYADYNGTEYNFSSSYSYSKNIRGTFIYCYFETTISSESTASISNRVYNVTDFGDDGTVVGMYGGTTPYDLNPAVPQVSSASIQVDQKAKKLKIQLEVVAE